VLDEELPEQAKVLAVELEGCESARVSGKNETRVNLIDGSVYLPNGMSSALVDLATWWSLVKTLLLGKRTGKRRFSFPPSSSHVPPAKSLPDAWTKPLAPTCT
jgi:hypothetical protein